MVKLNKIYTRTGDDGTTGLGTGERRLKSDLRVDAYGTVDEANACIGLARVHTELEHPDIDAMLGRVQNDLFDLGADLCVPDEGKPLGYAIMGVALLILIGAILFSKRGGVSTEAGEDAVAQQKAS